MTALLETFQCCSLSSFLRERFSTLFLVSLAIRTVKAGASNVRVFSSLTTGSSARHFCTAPATANRKAELCYALVTERYTTARTTDTTLVSGLSSVTRSAFSKSSTNASSIRAGILAICSRTVSSSLVDNEDRVSQILDVEQFSDMRPLARPATCLCSSLSRLKRPLPSAASNNWMAIGGFPTEFTVLYAAEILLSSWSIRSALQTTIIFSHSRRLDSIIQKFARIKNYKYNWNEVSERNQRKFDSKDTIIGQDCPSENGFYLTMRRRKKRNSHVPSRTK